MENPTRQRQLEELDQAELCTRILYQARNELYVNMHFLDVSLSSLGFEADWNRNGMACDGAVIYYGPGFLLGLYKKGRAVVNRYYLHTLFHCLFCHLYTRKGREKKMWDLACDIAMESVLDGMYEKCIHVLQSPLRREMYLRLRRFLTGNKNTGASNEEERKVVLTAERVYHALMEMELPKRRMEQLEAEFHVDDHDLWEQEPDPSAAMTRQNQWNDNRERMQTQMETMGAEEESENEQSLLDSIQVENEEEPFELMLANAVRIRGIIDRVDRLSDGSLGVVDYKSSHNTFDIQKFYNGLNPQLVTYMQALRDKKIKSESDKIFGAMYLHMQEPKVDLSSVATTEKILENLSKELRYRGLFLEDEKGYLSNGNYHLNDSVYTQEELDILLAYNQKLFLQAAEQIKQGHFLINPYSEDGKTVKGDQLKAITRFEADRHMPYARKWFKLPRKDRRQGFLSLMQEEEEKDDL